MKPVIIRGNAFEAPVGYFTGLLYYRKSPEDTMAALNSFKLRARQIGIYPRANDSWSFRFKPEERVLTVTGPFLVVPFLDRNSFMEECKKYGLDISDLDGPWPDFEGTGSEAFCIESNRQAAFLPKALMMRIAGPVRFATQEKDKNAAVGQFGKSCRALGIYTSPFGPLCYELDTEGGCLVVYGSFYAILLHGLDEFERGCREHGVEVSTDCSRPDGTPMRTGDFTNAAAFKGSLEYKTEAESAGKAAGMFEDVCRILGIYPDCKCTFEFDPVLRVLTARGTFFTAPHVGDADFRRRCLACGIRTDELFREAAKQYEDTLDVE